MANFGVWNSFKDSESFCSFCLSKLKVHSIINFTKERQGLLDNVNTGTNLQTPKKVLT